ncbi:MAG TPA: isoamylase early set domain-containing protein [Anaerolineae bacterium]|nr:isoamylase early set domain-containing protein [Anaerolineae bacterium]
MITKNTGNKPDTVLVTFQLPASIWAETVHLVGDFNGWNRSSHVLTRSKDDEAWQITLELEKGRVYQFRYLVDGTNWQNDWHADRYVPNPFGGDNSVLET